MKTFVRNLFLAIGLATFIASCDDNNESASTYVNDWIYANMDFAYYWNSTIPNNPDKSLNPDDFFESLLNRPEDRFSVIYDDYEEILNSLQGVSQEAGYEFTLYREAEDNNNVVAQVLYIKPNTPASNTNLKRGDIISHVNGTQMTLSNYQNLLTQMGQNHSITFRPIELTSSASGTWGTPVTTQLTVTTVEENPILVSKIFDLGNAKAGYLMYNFFADGVGETGTQYNDQLSEIIQSFKNQNVTDLIIDLRYNGGGYVTASIHLASLLGKDVDNTKIFTKREYNPVVVAEFNFTEEDLVEKFKTLSENIGSTLTGNIYFLVGEGTASASELVINGLRPYMSEKIVLIGEQTTGKNVGSVPVYEETNPRNRWIMLPIIVKSFNANDESDYGNGFFPDTEASEGFFLYELGNEDELLLSIALNQIAGMPTRSFIPKQHVFGKRLTTSMEFKKGTLRSMAIDRPLRIN